METEEKISQEELAKSKEMINVLWKYYCSRIVGQKNLGISLLVSLIANGHILLESVPGLAKTTAAKVITDSVAGKFSRIQCTPDLLPSDIVGTQIYNQVNHSFETELGPIYANFVLLDEINRSSAKTQSAMLEAMQEKTVTVGKNTYPLQTFGHRARSGRSNPHPFSAKRPYNRRYKDDATRRAPAARTLRTPR